MRKSIQSKNPEALLIVQTLRKEGFIAYFAGGAPRDLLLNNKFEDIDIATNATPEIIQKLFSHTIPVGIAFGIVIVVIHNKKFEVATFRKDFSYKDGRHPSEVKFASPKEDAKRRDFTINGMFYDPIENKILDFVGGREDLKNKIIRAIGDPEERIKEDRLRMIRAIRFATRLGFAIEEKTKRAIALFSSELFPSVAIERVWHEFEKMGSFLKPSLLQMYDLGLLQIIFPSLKLSKEEVEKRLSIPFPKNSPTIIPILELFRETTLKEQIALCKYLKLSNREIKFVSFLFNAKELMIKDNDDWTWAHFYANPLSKLILHILAAYHPKHFLSEHLNKQKELKKAIWRIRNHQPVVNSAHLKDYDILPGKQMGDLLKEAEKIAINNAIEYPSPIIDQLKKTTLWPK